MPGRVSRRHLLIGLSSMALLSAGCSSGQTAGTSTGAGTTAAGGSSGGGPAPAGKDTLTVVQAGDVPSLSPNIASQRAASRVSGEILEGAVKIKYVDGSPTLVPGLAESWSQTGPTTWEFKVRPNVTFTNGEKLTSKAFVDSLAQHRQDPAGKVSGVMKNIEIAAVDDMTFKVTTDSENLGSLPAQLTWLLIMPPEYRGKMTDAEFGNAPVGTGPYKLAKWDKGSAITLAANETYWGAKPAIKNIVIKTVPDHATAVGLLQTGAADVVTDVTPDLMERVRGISTAELVTAPTDFALFLVLSTASGPTKDLKVRQAINYAIDRQTILSKLYKDLADPLAGPITPGQVGYQKDFKSYDYNPDKAKALLAEAGNPQVEIDLNYTIGSSVLDDKLGEVLQAQLQEVGFKVNMKGGPFAKLQPLWRDPTKSSGMYMMSFGPIYPDSSFLFKQAYFDKKAVYGTWGSDAKVSEYADKAVATVDPTERAKLFSDAQQAAMDQALWAPILVLRQAVGVSKNLNWTPPADTRFYFEEATWK